jgi:hypothetical protein
MDRIRETDTSPVPALQRRGARLPRHVRVILITMGVCLAMTFAGMFWLMFQVRHETQERTATIVRELDKRTAIRDQETADTRRALCGLLLEEFPGSRNAAALAREFECP